MARPTSATSKSAWDDDELDGGEMQRRTDEAPAAMEAELYVDGQLRVIGEKNNKNVEEFGIPEQQHGFFTKVNNAFRIVWSTRQTEDTTDDKELHVKTTLRELAIYIVFLTVICIITFGMTSTNMYYYTKIMQDLFTRSPIDGSTMLTFEGMSSISDQWKFMRGQLLSGIYWDKWYNGEDVIPSERGYVYHENRLLGVPRIRQVRVRNDSCTVNDKFKHDIRYCYGAFTPDREDKASYGPRNGTAWTFSSEEKLDGSSHSGVLGDYSGGGYYLDMTMNKTEVEIILEGLYERLWINRGTRAVLIDFSTYNANINLFCIVRLFTEFPATGGAFPTSNFRTVKLIRYVEAFDYFIAACEFIFVIYLVYYTVEEAIEIKKNGTSYFKSMWNWLDIVVLFIGYISALFSVYRFMKVNSMMDGLLDKPQEYADFDFVSRWQTNASNAMAIMVFFAWIKIFKYISFNKTMVQLSGTMSRCANDLAGFSVMFGIVFLAFAQLGYLIFGTQVTDFRTYPDSIFTLFRIILGDFNFVAMSEADPILGPTYFMLYVFFVFFVLINMFLAIINDTYSEVKGELDGVENEFQLGEFFKKNYSKVLEKMSIKKDKLLDIQDALKSANTNGDKLIDFEEWRHDLKNRGYAENEIEAVFAKYDLDGDRQLDEYEQRKMFADLEGQKTELEKAMDELDEEDEVKKQHTLAARAASNNGGRASYDEFVILSRRVDRMEHSIGSIVSKIDAVLVKLESMESSKVKRRAAMSRMLDTINESDASESNKRLKMEQMVREEMMGRFDAEPLQGPVSTGTRRVSSKIRSGKKF